MGTNAPNQVAIDFYLGRSYFYSALFYAYAVPEDSSPAPCETLQITIDFYLGRSYFFLALAYAPPEISSMATGQNDEINWL